MCLFLWTEKFLIPLQLTKGRHNGYPKVVKLHGASNSSFKKEGVTNTRVGFMVKSLPFPHEYIQRASKSN